MSFLNQLTVDVLAVNEHRCDEPAVVVHIHHLDLHGATAEFFCQGTTRVFPPWLIGFRRVDLGQPDGGAFTVHPQGEGVVRR